MYRYGMNSPRHSSYRNRNNRYAPNENYGTSNTSYGRGSEYDDEGYSSQYDEYNRDEDYGQAYGSIDNRTRETGVRPRAGRYAYEYGPSRQDTDYLYDYSRGESRPYGEQQYNESPWSSQNYEGRGSYGGHGQYGNQNYNRDYDRNYGRRYGNYGRGSYRSQNYANNYGLGFSRGYDRHDHDRYNESRGWNDYDTHYQKDEGIMEKVGRFFGMGPKGYKRSDERIQEDANEALYSDPYVDASEIEVSVKDGVITLSGTVDSRTAKRQAEDCVEDVTGVKDVINNIRVESTSSSFSPTASKSSSRKEGSSTNTRSSVQ